MSKKQVKTNGYAFGNLDDDLYTSGIGSCVVMVVWEPLEKIGSLSHMSLPLTALIPENGKMGKNPTKTIPYIIQAMMSRGAKKELMQVSLFGGGDLFNSTESMNIGAKLILEAKKCLTCLGIDLKNEDTGGSVGRAVSLKVSNGQITVDRLDGMSILF
ncbi:MAG: chemotaxis protein CheD [Bdellovibrionota bacterium]|nr:chemotaxis protein CheD [Bdellovibrionota bacterium]